VFDHVVRGAPYPDTPVSDEDNTTISKFCVDPAQLPKPISKSVETFINNLGCVPGGPI